MNNVLYPRQGVVTSEFVGLNESACHNPDDFAIDKSEEGSLDCFRENSYVHYVAKVLVGFVCYRVEHLPLMMV